MDSYKAPPESSNCLIRSPKPVAGIALFTAILLAGLLFGVKCAIPEGDEQHVFSTWDDFEVDKCASIWLIKRFVDKNADFRFFPKGEALRVGIPFDTPDAQLRRYHNMSTFESIIARYQITDEKLAYVSKIVHDSEVNVWGKKVMPETTIVEDMVNSMIINAKSKEEVIQKSIEYFDALYNKE